MDHTATDSTTPPLALSPDELLLYACVEGNLEAARRFLVEDGADPTAADDEDRSTLFFAASGGHLALCQLLVEHGHPWNALDAHGKTAAEYAQTAGHTDVYEWLVNEGVRAERVFKALRAMGAAPEQPDTNSAYLQQKLVYTADGDRLLDAENNGVMMGWERPLMRASVDAIVPRAGLRVLNVGYGLGIIDKMIADTQPAEHHIIEAHPDVLARIRETRDMDHAVVHAGTWRDVVPDLLAAGTQFDAIYFDTYAEYFDDLAEFTESAVDLLAPGGMYSWFHGGGASNAVFNEVYRRIATDDCLSLGFLIDWERLDMAPLGDEVWQGIRLNYFSLDHYWLPIATKIDDDE
ncbi:Arginine N-methyltransferase 2 [Blastocladiella emersonii ATCC 22665]|nr:Arginine N-methyltransferase 2 [Blastocladiella emersonii ATCC 22665]